MITGHRTEGATSPSDRTARVLAIARRCLDETSTARFGSCREVIAALSEAQGHAIPGPQSAWRRTPVLGAALVVAALSTGLVAWVACNNALVLREGRFNPLLSSRWRASRANPDDEIFADGMTGALITNLAKIRAFHVVSRTSVMQYKNTQKSVPQIGRELNVDAIVEGTIERVGNRVRISTQLIRTATDQHLWTDAYDRDARDVLLLQNEVAESVARQVRVTLTPEERARLGKARAVRRL